MADFATPPLKRDQLVLFPEKLDQIIAANHRVRLLDEILRRVDWSAWEVLYDLTRGQPPIHPRVIASAILYGIMNRIRTSRALEEALGVRTDFRWLVENRSIDHSTISKFRQKNAEALKALFVQIVLIARELGYVPLVTLGFDGTRMRADNRKSGTRTPEELRQAKAELEAKFAELEAKTAAADESDNERLGNASDHQLAEELADVNRRRRSVDAALAEIERLEAEGQKVPKRLPITDPQSRVTPNKDGGFAPNYTPHATVDIDSGVIVSADVICNTDEDKHMISSIEDVEQSFGLDRDKMPDVLADGMMSTGDNLAQCEAKGINLYSPIKLGSSKDNPAVREDPGQPVPEADWDGLPTTTTKHKDGSQSTKLNKDAFIYDEEQDCYWCPAGKPLPYSHQTSQIENGRRRIRFRYKSDPSDCAQCPLASLCLGNKSKRRIVGHEQHEALRIEHAEKMAKEESQKKYQRRCHAGERPFAMIKNHFGARSFLTRGLDNVRGEWLWLSSAFNLHCLMSLIASRAGPPATNPTS